MTLRHLERLQPLLARVQVERPPAVPGGRLAARVETPRLLLLATVALLLDDPHADLALDRSGMSVHVAQPFPLGIGVVGNSARWPGLQADETVAAYLRAILLGLCRPRFGHQQQS